MKIRKALAVVLSLAMTVTLMPATAFASTAKVANVPTVKDGASANTLVRVTLDEPLLAGEDNEQQFSLEVTQNGEFTKFTENTKKVVTLASLNDTDKDGASVVVGVIPETEGTPAYEVVADEYPGDTHVTGDDKNKIYVEKTDARDKSMDITLTLAAGSEKLVKDSVLYFYVNVDADGSDGDEVQLALDSDATVIDGFSAKTIAYINGAGTTAAVEDADTVGRTSGVTAAEVTIKEVTNDAVSATEKNDEDQNVDKTQSVKFSLPKGVAWVVGGVADDGTVTVAKLTDGNEDYTQISGTMLGATKIKTAKLTNDGRDLTVTFVAKGNDEVKEKLVLTPVISVGKDAGKGDIKLKIDGTGDISDESGLVIAVYGDANVNILCKDADKLPEVVAGKEQNKDKEDFVVSVTLEENSAGALTSGKYIDFAFTSDMVQVKDATAINAYLGDKYAKKEYDDGKDASAFITDIENGVKNDRSEWTLTIPKANAAVGTGNWKEKEANTLTLFIPVTVSADYTGDIALTLKGNAGIDETTVTVGKVVAPVTATFTVTNVVNGAQAQATADITITENFAGALAEGYVDLKINDLGLGGVVFKNDGTAKVTAGDLEIKDSEKNRKQTVGDKEENLGANVISVKIDDESTTASTITVSGLAINLARILPEGEYDLQIGGTALVENNRYNDGDFSKNAVKDKYINITTAADTAQTGIVANFYLDGSKNSTYAVNGVDATMDAAAYLDSNNRTMVPIRYVAYALGLADTDISYNVGDSTATLSGLTNVVKVTTGSNVLQASNGNVVMDTVAVNNSGRLYVPARFIAQAMGAQVAWDQATKTVTITK